MIFDIDCVRAILLELEDRLTVEINEDGEISNNDIDPQELAEIFEGEHRREAVYYALRKLGEADYINKCVYSHIDGTWEFSMINEISFAGHQFLEVIRPKSIWDKTRDVTKRVGSASVSFIAQVASGFLSDLAKGAFMP